MKQIEHHTLGTKYSRMISNGSYCAIFGMLGVQLVL